MDSRQGRPSSGLPSQSDPKSGRTPDNLDDEDPSWVLIDNMEDIASGMGLVAADKEVPVDFTARQAFRKKVLKTQQQEYQVSAQKLLLEKQDEIKAPLERQQMQMEQETEGRGGRGGRGGKKGDTSITATNPTPSSRGRQQMDARERAMQDALYHQELHLQQAYEENLAMMKIGAVRRDVQAINTQKLYAKYQKHWNKWCRRRKYKNNDVENKRFVLYMTENTALVPDPANGIEPIRVGARGGRKRKRSKKAASKKPRSNNTTADIVDDSDIDASDSDDDFSPFQDYSADDKIDDDDEPYNPNGALPAYDTLDMYIKAAVDLQLIQRMNPAKAYLKNEPSPRCPETRTLMTKHLLRLAELKTSTDSDNIVIEDGHGLSTLKQILKDKWTHNYMSRGGSGKHRLVGLRARVFDSWSHYMMPRGESTRMALLPDIFSHAFETLDNSGQLTFGVVLMMFRGKTNREGKQQHGVIVRNKDVEICPISCLAFYLVELWMTSPADVPDFTQDDWKKYSLLSNSKDPSTPVSYSGHYTTSRNSWALAGKPSNKATHEHRGAGARHAQEAGADISAIAQHGHWLHDRVSTHYLSHIPSGVALKMAGCTMPGERLWLARNTVIPPAKLQRQIFPFIEDYFKGPAYKDWMQWTENIMMDNAVTYNRPNVPKEAYASSSHLLRLFVLLTRLRKVVLQDAAVLMDINTDPLCDYSKHHIFCMPVFNDPLFYEFRIDLRKSIATTVSPQSLKLSTVTPLISHEIRTLHGLVTTAFEKLDQRFIGMDGALKDTQHIWSTLLSKAVGRQLQESEVKIAEVCNLFLGAVNTFVDASASAKENMAVGLAQLGLGSRSNYSTSGLSASSQPFHASQSSCSTQSTHQALQTLQLHANQTRTLNAAKQRETRAQRDAAIAAANKRQEELRLARLGKQPVGRGSSSTANAVTSPAPSSPEDCDNDNDVEMPDPSSDNAASPSCTQVLDSQSDSSSTSSSNNPNLAPIQLLPPGPGGPLISGIPNPFDIDALHTDKLRFSWLENLIATPQVAVRLHEVYTMLPRDLLYAISGRSGSTGRIPSRPSSFDRRQSSS